MLSPRPETLTDKELEKYAYQIFKPFYGTPVEVQAELLKRFGERIDADAPTYHEGLLKIALRYK